MCFNTLITFCWVLEYILTKMAEQYKNNSCYKSMHQSQNSWGLLADMVPDGVYLAWLHKKLQIDCMSSELFFIKCDSMQSFGMLYNYDQCIDW